MRTIGLEEHYATTEFLNGPGAWQKSRTDIASALTDLGDGRIAAMDDAGVDLSVLSLVAPGVEQLDGPAAQLLARRCNDELAAAVANHPDRLAGFAALPISSPQAAVDELHRCLTDHGFVGAVINGHCQGCYLDDAHFDPILASAAELNAPIYLHPTFPPAAVIESCYAGFSEEVSFALATSGWGWHVNTATHALRMILGGVFDRHPTLQIVLGHMGETTSFMLPRFDARMPPELTGLRRPISAYLRENFFYTFASFNDQATFANLLSHVGIDRIAFSTDHPFGSMTAATAFLDDLPLTVDQRAAISHRNAERLLSL